MKHFYNIMENICIKSTFLCPIKLEKPKSIMTMLFQLIPLPSMLKPSILLNLSTPSVNYY